VQDLVVDFKTVYLIPGETDIAVYLDKQEEYFDGIESVTIATDSELDWKDEHTQYDLIEFNQKIMACPDCT